MALLKNLQLVLTGLCGIALLLCFLPGASSLAFASVLFGSYYALKTSFDSLRHRQVDVNLLMVVAAIGAVAVGQPKDAAALLFLFSLSSTLESYTMARTRSAIEGLVKLRPAEALRINNGVEERIKVEKIELGDLIRIPSFETVPVDGEIVEGNSSLNQAAMTGESVAVSKTVGDKVLAGTQNLEGMLLTKATSVVGNSTLDKIVHLVDDAQKNKASGERISAWFGQTYTFFVLGVFILSLGIRYFLHVPFSDSLYQSLTLLVALSPCALVISTPATTLSALAWSAKNGILIRGGEFIERAGAITMVAVDKTGTLTVGRPELVEICVCDGKPLLALARSNTTSTGGAAVCGEEGCWLKGSLMSETARRLLALAAGAEKYANHPVAEAVMHAAKSLGVDVLEAGQHQTVPGLGITATVDGQTVRIGQTKYLESEKIDLPPEFLIHVEKLQKQGMTVALLAVGDSLAALGFMDIARPEAKEFINQLHSAGVKQVTMLTGDTPETAYAVAAQVGVDQVQAGLLPDQKSAAVKKLGENGEFVMMVGDGINDAPSLAGASIGVAMGGLGSDVALNAADIVLMNDNLSRIPLIIKLGRRTNGIIRANLTFAISVILTLTVLSLFTHLPLPIAVIGHEGSTVLVILNGLRLLRGPN